MKIRTSPRQDQDFLAWQPEKNGRFTVKSAYRLATLPHDTQFAGGASSLNSNGDCSIWNLIWRSSVPWKMEVTAWKSVSGALATSACKAYRHLATCGTCTLCGVEDKDNLHPLVACSNARSIRERMRTIWSLPSDECLVHRGNEWIFDVLLSCTGSPMWQGNLANMAYLATSSRLDSWQNDPLCWGYSWVPW